MFPGRKTPATTLKLLLVIGGAEPGKYLENRVEAARSEALLRIWSHPRWLRCRHTVARLRSFFGRRDLEKTYPCLWPDANDRTRNARIRADSTSLWVPPRTRSDLMRPHLRAADRASALGRIRPSIYPRTKTRSPSVFHLMLTLDGCCHDRVMVPRKRPASSRSREPRPGRRPPLWPSHLRDDGGSVSHAGAKREGGPMAD